MDLTREEFSFLFMSLDEELRRDMHTGTRIMLRDLRKKLAVEFERQYPSRQVFLPKDATFLNGELQLRLTANGSSK